jgi:hypothetical protein
MDIQLPYDPEFLESLNKNAQTMFTAVNRAMENAREAMAIFVHSIQEIPESTKLLAENGWYMPFDFHPVIVNRMAENIREGNVELADIEMVRFLDEELSNIQKHIIERFPKREKAIVGAMEAHKKGEYYLSIPVFFAQIEGICKELVGIRFFKIRKDDPKTSLWVSNFESDSILRLLLEPLITIGPIRSTQDENNPLGINRHDVLHGDCTDYGDTKLNSYKVLSLLNYVSDTVYEAKKHIDEKKSKNP